jgi:hypothetical protein
MSQVHGESLACKGGRGTPQRQFQARRRPSCHRPAMRSRRDDTGASVGRARERDAQLARSLPQARWHRPRLASQLPMRLGLDASVPPDARLPCTTAEPIVNQTATPRGPRFRLTAYRRQPGTPLCPSMIAPAPRRHRSSPAGGFQSTPRRLDLPSRRNTSLTPSISAGSRSSLPMRGRP